MIQEAAAKARANAEKHAAVAPKRIAREDLGVKIVRFAGSLGAEHDRRVRERLEIERHRERLARLDRIAMASNVPPKYAAARPDELHALPAALDGNPVAGVYRQKMQSLQRLAFGPAVVALIGTRGPGKTWMACALVNAYVANGMGAEYHEVSDYFLALKATYDEGAKLNQETVEARWLAPRLLVLDEMQERGNTGWEDQMLTRLVNKRYAAELTTILVSNQDLDAFQDRVGASILDRINDGGGIITCEWPSLRGRLGGEVVR